MNYCRVGGLMSLAAGLMLGLSHCGEDDLSRVIAANQPDPRPPAGSRCVPGQTLGCLGVCGQPLAGYQICAADGRSYDECICPTPERIDPLEIGGSATVIPRRPEDVRPLRPGRGDPPPPVADTVGAACEADADCAPGLDCYAAGSNAFGGRGGAAHGYCTKACRDLEDCASVDPLGSCETVAGQDVCVRTCLSKEPEAGEAKCLDRADVLCVSVAALGSQAPSADPQPGICVPFCQSDAACGGGRRCDLRTGLCTDEPAAGEPIGSACDAAAECGGGICVAPSAQAERFCSAFCTIGVPGCGFDGSEPPGSIGATCLLNQVPGEGQGDRGLCFALCDVDSDCLEPGSLCVDQPESGRAGVCVRPRPVEQPPVTGTLVTGRGCESDTDCGGAFVCIAPDDDPFGAGGGPPGGYCSSPCSAAAPCTEAGTRCLGNGVGTFCLRGCVLDAADDCGGRETLVCTEVGSSGTGFCRPQCNTDADCPGRACDLDSGFCVEAPSPPECESDADCVDQVCDEATSTCVDAVEPPPECESDADCVDQVCDELTGTCAPEAACSVDADCGDDVCNPTTRACIDAPAVPAGGACTADAECAGEICQPFDDSTFCTGSCVYGTQLGCEAYGSDVFCLVPLDDFFGLCIELCDAPSDCAQAGYECVPVNPPVNGRTGGCLPPLPAVPPVP